MSVAAVKHTAETIAQAVADAFPEVDPRHAPVAEFVIVQLRLAKTITSGGIHLIEDSVQTESDTTQVAKVIRIGPGAFRRRDNGEQWATGAWYKVGDFVRAPRYGGDRWKIDHLKVIPERKVGTMIVPEQKITQKVEFALFKDLDIRLIIEGNPLDLKAYV